MSEVQNVHLFNCDKTYKFDAVEVWLEKEKSKQAFSVQRHYFSLAEMFEISNETIPGLNMDLAVFVIHAHDSYWSIDEENGYTIIYRSLLQKTGDNVIVVIGGDDNYRNEEEENKEFISRWAKRKVPSQFKDEYMDGRKGFILSWNENHREIHEEVLRHFLDPSKTGTKFEYKPKLSSRPETEKKDGCQQSKRDSFSEDKKRANQDFSSIEGFVMLRSRLKFGRLTNDVEIHYPGFNVPHCLAQRMYETHRNTSDVVVEVRSDGRGGYAWFPSTKRSLVSLGEDETVVLKTRLCNGLISQEKGKLEFVYPDWRAPTYLIEDLRENYKSCPDRELYIISNEKGNLRGLVVKEGRVDSFKKVKFF